MAEVKAARRRRKAGFVGGGEDVGVSLSYGRNPEVQAECVMEEGE
jgi:hypothetical protein